ncbi:MAG: hypothetical protein ACRDP8_01750 [Actinopolymorphaceae bacterium]
MRRRIGLLLAVGFAAAWIPASPANADDTIVTFTVTTGALDISAPTGPVALTNGTLVPGGTASGQIGTVAVTDTRGISPAVWHAHVSSTPWADGVGVTNIPSTAATYSGGPTTQTGDGVCAAEPDAPIATTPADTEAVQHQGGTGGNTCSWNPTITVNIPVTASAATYTTTLQHLVAPS